MKVNSLNLDIYLSYLIDYCLSIGLICGFQYIGDLTPRYQRFSLTNASLLYPYKEDETVTSVQLVAYAFIIPLGAIAIITLFTGRKISWKNRLWDLNCGFLSLLVAHAGAGVVYNSLKIIVGKPRPDVVSRCEPSSFTVAAGTLADISYCTSTNMKRLNDGFRSFPSGHSGASFAGLTVLSCLIACRVRVFDGYGYTWKMIISMAPLVGAVIIACSRVNDGRHHPFDVVFGSILGFACAIGAFTQYFPSPLEFKFKKYDSLARAPRNAGFLTSINSKKIPIINQDLEVGSSQMGNNLGSMQNNIGSNTSHHLHNYSDSLTSLTGNDKGINHKLDHSLGSMEPLRQFPSNVSSTENIALSDLNPRSQL